MLLFFGSGLTILVPVLLLVNLYSRFERRRYARMRLSRCEDITRPDRRLRAVEGRTRPGPAGMLTAPLSGEPCVWYWAQVTRREGGEAGDSRIWESGGDMPFAIQDETGTVLVHGKLVHPQHSGSGRVGHKLPPMRTVAQEPSRYQESEYLRELVSRGTLTEKTFKRNVLQLGWGVYEYILQPNIPLHVQGKPIRRDGHVMIGGWRTRGKELVTTHTFVELRDEVIPEDVRGGTGCLLMSAVTGPVMLAAGLLIVFRVL